MESKIKIGTYKGHKFLSIEGIGAQGKTYTIIGAGKSKWAQVLSHLDEIKAFVEEDKKTGSISTPKEAVFEF